MHTIIMRLLIILLTFGGTLLSLNVKSSLNIQDGSYRPLPKVSGVIFRIQLNSSKKLLPYSRFRKAEDVMIDTVGAFIKYYSGNFRYFESASIYEQDMINVGYKRSKVVAFMDGKFITLSTAQEIVALSFTETTEPMQPPQEEEQEMQAVVARPGIEFRLQMAASGKPISLKEGKLKDISDIFYEKGADGYYRYFKGTFPTFEEATALLRELNAAGHKGPFVVAYKDGKKIPVTQAIAEAAQPATPAPEAVQQAEKIEFRVQIAASNRPLPANYDRFQGFDVYGTKGSDGYYRYYVGRFPELEAAKLALKELMSKGFPSAFIVAYKKDTRISIAEAQSLLEQEN